MRFFKANPPPRSAEDDAVSVRLSAIAIRGKAASLPEWAQPAPPEPSDERQGPELLQ